MPVVDAADAGNIDIVHLHGVAARAQQPGWSSPIATTTALLEQRFRFDVEDEHSGNGTGTTILDGGKGLDLIVSGSNEIQLALAPYEFRSGTAASPGHTGFGDWAFLRLEQRLASSPEDKDDYVVSAWLQIQAPVGIAALFGVMMCRFAPMNAG